MWSAGLNEAQARIKIAGKNMHHCVIRYANDMTPIFRKRRMTKEIKAKEESEKVGLKLNI